MTESHPGYEWPEGRGNPPRRVELDDKEDLENKTPFLVGSPMARAHQKFLDSKRKEGKRGNNGASE